ncbi:MAG TPA: 2Fe-2S iron-sulfur cluster-binding protein, partial [Acidisoma sp.]|nr:2Fe-2S iron-sulfur cluster-binding protein [Acidisoma sp.]
MSAEPRLGAGWGLLIDRQRPLSFTFDGMTYLGFEGDVIASALLAAGRVVMSRSFKYHRPRGPLTMAGHDVNSLAQVGAEPNVRGDRHRIAANMAVTSVNRLGRLDRDLFAVLGLFSRFLPVGFYYKTFFWPRGAWAFFEKPIRALAGLGRLDPRAQHGYFDKVYLFCDVLVVGAGPAGLEAAIAAAESGADTLLIEEWPEAGGSLLFGRVNGSRAEAVARRAALLAKADALPNLRLMTETVVSGLFADHWAAALQGNRLYKIRAGRTVLATGAYDQPLVFKNNDLPGIMFADAAQRLMRHYGVKPGKRAVIATANRFGFDTTLDLLDAGVEVAAIVDMSNGTCADQSASLAARGVRVLEAPGLYAARGKRRVEAVAVPRDAAGQGAPEWIICDTLLMSVGYTPALNLACHMGARAVYDPAIAMHRAEGLPAGLSLAGTVAGIWADDLIAPHAAAIGRGESPAAIDSQAGTITHPWPMPEMTEDQPKNFIDFDEDLISRDIVGSVQDGYDDIQLVKRYSTAGLGPSQGRHANLNTIRLVARATGRSIAAVGTTTFRPPLVPEKFGHLAGRGFEPTRLSPMHQRHVEAGAQM